MKGDKTMLNEINEMGMEMETAIEPAIELVEEVCKDAIEGEIKSGNGLGKTVLIIGGVALCGLAVAGVIALKNKNSDESKKQKTKWHFGRVPAESEDYEEEWEEEEVETIPEEDVTDEDTKK